MRVEFDLERAFKGAAIAALFCVAVLIIIVAMYLLGGCSAEYMREKPIATDLHKYCLDHPKDSACQGPNSK